MTSRTTTASASKAPSASSGTRLTRLALALTTALTPVGVMADTLPTGGNVVHGSATIGAPNAGNLTINQSSDRAVVNWDGFSIGAGNTVNINQPSIDAAILNRVTGDTTSQIHGQLNANGRVFVVNPNGIFIGATGSVNTGSFVASTLGIRTDDFAVGQTVFEGDGSSAVVRNEGSIQVVTGGYAALIGGQVSNSGSIQAPMGFVGLGSGERITLDLGGDGFMQVAIPTDTDDPELQALIENSGTIQANGGTVQLSAATARNAARHAINMSGVIEARTVSGRNGRITLGGGGGGTVSVSGKVRTKARRPAIQVTQSARPAARPARGGDITITGQNITLAGAEIDASGPDGGGHIRIGGNLQGAPGLLTADTLSADAATAIYADGILTGDGGRVILWSEIQTDFAGNISIQGGSVSGNGGFAEVSGKVNLAYTGFTSALAENGETGELLLDPSDIEIVQTVPVLNQINNVALEGQLATANVTLNTSDTNTLGDTGVITAVVTAPFSWTSGNTLTLIADDDIILNSTITPGTGGGLVLDAADEVIINGTIEGADSTLVFDAGTNLIVAGSGTINGTNADISLDALNDIDISGEIIAPGSTTSLVATNEVLIDSSASLDTLGGVATLDGDSVNIQGQATVSETDVDTSLFIVGPDGNWLQNNATLGGFIADNFVINNGSFLRVLGGNGGSTPFQLADVYGLQGVGSFNSGIASYILDDNIDASDATSWESLDAPVNGVVDSGFVPLDFGGLLDGDDHSISNLTVTRHFATPGSTGGGLFLTNNGLIQNLGFINATIDAPSAGVVAEQNNGLIDGVSVQGAVRAFSTVGQGAFAGGIVAVNGANATISNSSVSVTDIRDVIDPSSTSTIGAEGAAIGGIAGRNQGTITATSSELSTFSVTEALAGDVGGIAGTNSGSISDSYSTATVRAATTATNGSSVGGITGDNAGTLVNVLANGSVILAGPGTAGGVTGTDAPGNETILSSFFNTETTGQTVSGQNGETFGSTNGAGQFEGAFAETTASLNEAQAFFEAALVSGWDFENVWSLPLDGSDQARLYSVDTVISAFGPATDPTFEYNGTTTGFSTTGTIVGGPLITRMNLNDTGDTSVLNDQITLSSADAGAVTYTFPNTFTSDQGVPYSVRQLTNNATIDPAAITLTLNDANKTYGDTLTFGDVSFTTTGTFFGTDGITSATVDSFGADATAEVAGNPYDLDLNTFVGDNLANYDITTVPAELTIDPRALTIDVDNATKAVGDTLTFAGTEFSVTGLVNNDTVGSLTIDSLGAPAGAAADGSPYAITGINPIGTGLGNYTVTINSGQLTVTGGAAGGGGEPVDAFTLNIFLNNISKTYGDTIAFDGTEFSATGLNAGDTLTSLTITSAGAGADATVANGPYAINGSNPIGTGLGSYEITIIPGTLTIQPAPLLITAEDQSKRTGTGFVFNGDEFTVSGLVNGDAVTAATLTSAAAAIDAGPTGAGGTAILITNPEGTGLENYAITLVGGVFVVAPGDLIITANDLTKVYGEEFVFDGSEFTVTGLADGDSVDSITLTSLGADTVAGVGSSPYAVIGSAAVGTGLENYDLVFADGSLTVIAAPLTITAFDQNKEQGQQFTFAGTEFSAAGLLNGDSVDAAVLNSLGADAGALADDGPFAITVDSVSGSGLENYDIASVDGLFTVGNTITPPQINPVGGGNSTISNPADTINIALPGVQADLGSVQESRGSGGTGQSLADAQETQVVVGDISEDLETAIMSCGNADQDFSNYMACLSESLDTYANALDQISNDLPSGFENVSAVIQNARAGVDAAAARAQRRLATAATPAQRSAIRRDAINEARGAINEAKEEIRKAISLIRADDPEVAAVQRDTGARIVQAFDTVDSELVRAVEL